MSTQKYSFYSFSVQAVYPETHWNCPIDMCWVYEIYVDGEKIESNDWFDTKVEAEDAARYRIDEMESGEG